MDYFASLKRWRRNPGVGISPTKMTCPVVLFSVGRVYFVVELVVNDIDQSQCFPASSTIIFTSSCRR